MMFRRLQLKVKRPPGRICDQSMYLSRHTHSLGLEGLDLRSDARLAQRVRLQLGVPEDSDGLNYLAGGCTSVG